MRTKEYVHRGWTQAAAFVIDVGLVGEAAAQQRVLDLYRPGVRLHAIDDRHWLLVMPEPVEIDARTAPGLVLVESGGRLVGAPEIDDAEAEIAFWQLGAISRATRSVLPEIDPSEWIQVDDLPIDRLHAIDRPLPTEAEEPAKRPVADLRKIAHVRERSAESEKFGAALADQGTGRPVGVGAGGGARPAGGGGGPDPLGALGSFIASLVLRSPLGGEVRRRQVRYLERLAGQFDGDLEEALRNAIPLGGLGSAAYTLRIPRRRTQLKITRQGLQRQSSIDLGPTVYASLRAMYQRAATQLEADGRLEESVFVHVELLNNPLDGIAMLERHGRLELAATIAEDRQVDPVLVVRLWWLAGDRARAVSIARRHRTFAQVIERLHAVDPAQARELRLEWVDTLERAGDLLGAVTAGWPDVHVRPLLGNVVRRGADSGGPVGAALQAYRLALRPTDEDLAETRSLLAGFGPDDAAALRAFVLALVDAIPEQPVDRELASLTLRAMTRIRREADDRAYLKAHRAIRDRADPLLRADLPATGAHHRPVSVIQVPSQPPGLVPILDAAPLPNDLTLVGLGDAGCRLLTPDGRIAAHWEIPTHRLVVADHGGSVLLVSARGEISEVVRLDLTTRKARPYGAVRSTLFADTFDGAIWPVVDLAGVAFHDTIADAPKVSWRELETGWVCYRLTRDEHQLAALVGIPASAQGDGRLELWRWTLPGITLNARAPVKLDDIGDEVALTADAVSIWRIAGASPKVIEPHATRDFPIALPTDGIRASQEMVGLVRQTTEKDCEIVVHRTSVEPEPWLRVPLAIDGAAFRAVGDRIAAWDGTGRLVTADAATRRLITVTRLA